MLTVALDELTVPERVAFVLRHYEGRGIEEIASRLGVRQGCGRAGCLPRRPKASPGLGASEAGGAMKHLNSEEMLALYYGESDADATRHVEACTLCHLEFDEIRRVLNATMDLPLPERDEQYGPEVWRRIQLRLPLRKRSVFRFRWIWLGPAFAAVAVAAFLMGVFAQRQVAGGAFSEQARNRILLMAMSDHLERSQMMLAELVNADARSGHLAEEKAIARDLLAENRLLRDSAGKIADPLTTSVLERLERVLMDVANQPSHPSEQDLVVVQERIRSEGLLLQVRVTSARTRNEGQLL